MRWKTYAGDLALFSLFNFLKQVSFLLKVDSTKFSRNCKKPRDVHKLNNRQSPTTASSPSYESSNPSPRSCQLYKGLWHPTYLERISLYPHNPFFPTATPILAIPALEHIPKGSTWMVSLTSNQNQWQPSSARFSSKLLILLRKWKPSAVLTRSQKLPLYMANPSDWTSGPPDTSSLREQSQTRCLFYI